MYDVILFPTDGSEEAAAALDHAIELARDREATLDVLLVETEEVEGEPAALLEEPATAARDAGLDVNTTTMAGVPHEAIAEYVADRGVDAVVMATHARRGLDRYVQGSVTEQVLRSVDVPVLVVPLDAEE